VAEIQQILASNAPKSTTKNLLQRNSTTTPKSNSRGIANRKKVNKILIQAAIIGW
jgi:hypothetical protein